MQAARQPKKETTMTTLSVNQAEDDDQTLLLSQYYSNLYSKTAPGETRTRKRRKKVKGESAGVGWKKRRLSAEQVNFLELNFGSEHKLESARKDRLAMELELDPRQVAVWFQNRRARWKSKQMEEEFARLKAIHEAVLVDKCKLQAEVEKLREELSEAQKDIRKLAESERCCSPSSCSSMNVHQHFLEEFGYEITGDFLYVPESDGCVGDMGWLDLFS